MLRRVTTIFLDNGDVLSDNRRRAVEWRRLIGEFLAPRLGGTPTAWGEANRDVFERQWQRFLGWLEARSPLDWGDFFAEGDERARWLREMCEQVGVEAPADCASLAYETERYIVPRVRAAHRGAPEAVEALHRRGYALHTASGDPSWDLHHCLTGMGVRDYFARRLYGPDLVRALKAGPVYYERIFRDAGVEPAEALVVDNDPRALAWAAEAGAATALVGADGGAAGAVIAVQSLAELPGALDGP
jgi:beta-phosphoglucomutase-like phosphatase (HAD superfamily)